MRPIEVDAREALAFLDGKSLAVVGNSADLLARSHGAAIDAHDAVLRMNYGIPGWREAATAKAIGRRTDVVAAARIRPVDEVLAQSCPSYLWWMKLTTLGGLEYLELLDSELLTRRGVRLWLWPREYEREVATWVGSPPSTGIRVLHAVCTRVSPARVSAFGMSWWGAAGGSDRNWWNPKRQGPAPAHQPTHEFRAFRSLGFAECEPGWAVRE